MKNQFVVKLYLGFVKIAYKPGLDPELVSDDDVEEEKDEVRGHGDQGEAGVPEGLEMLWIVKAVICLRLPAWNQILEQFH